MYVNNFFYLNNILLNSFKFNVIVLSILYVKFTMLYFYF